MKDIRKLANGLATFLFIWAGILMVMCIVVCIFPLPVLTTILNIMGWVPLGVLIIGFILIKFTINKQKLNNKNYEA